MSTETIYARVPTEVREALDVYVNETGQTLAHAVSELVRRGLAGSPAPGPESVEITRLELDIATAIVRLRQLDREEPPDSFLWHRVITCDVPRLLRYLGPAARDIADLGSLDKPVDSPAEPT